MLISSVWREGSRWWFSAGLLAGGLTSAVVAAALGFVLLRPWLPVSVGAGLVAAVYLLVVLNEVGVVRLSLPQNGRQVPESIGDDGARYGALHFGFEMGTGVRTYMTTGLPHALVVAILLASTWPVALLAGLGFGAGRAWMTLARHGYRDDQGWDQHLARHDRSVRILTTTAAALAVAAILYAGFA